MTRVNVWDDTRPDEKDSTHCYLWLLLRCESSHKGIYEGMSNSQGNYSTGKQTFSLLISTSLLYKELPKSWLFFVFYCLVSCKPNAVIDMRKKIKKLFIPKDGKKKNETLANTCITLCLDNAGQTSFISLTRNSCNRPIFIHMMTWSSRRRLSWYQVKVTPTPEGALHCPPLLLRTLFRFRWCWAAPVCGHGE